ncbi:MAG: hypothetical protein AAGG44_21215, partial [Planctomycetota bacterium]
MHVLSWKSVRHLSQLSLLNRIAFVMLFLVPLLSGFLRPVRVSVDKANVVLDATQNRLADNAIVEGAGAAIGLLRGFQQSLAGEPGIPEQPQEEVPPIASDIDGSIAPSRSVAADKPTEFETDDSGEIEEPVDQVGLFFPVGWQDGEGESQSGGLPWNIRTPFLPRPWTLAFVAALMILLGDTVTQLFCPEIVRLDSLADYVRKQADAFGKCP